MKKILFFIFLLSLTNLHSFCQQAYDFSAESKKKSQQIQQIDSVSLYYYTQCRAVYPAYGIFKSHMPSKNNLLKFLKKKHPKIYKQARQINSACQLYQDSEDNELVFDLYKRALPQSFDFAKEQEVACDLLIMQIYGEGKKETLRFIISMKQPDLSKK